MTAATAEACLRTREGDLQGKGEPLRKGEGDQSKGTRDSEKGSRVGGRWQSRAAVKGLEGSRGSQRAQKAARTAKG